MSATITVRGRGVTTATPDEAVLNITLWKVLTKAESALADVAKRSAKLRTIFSNLEIEEADRISSGVSVREEREYRDGSYLHRGYRASSSVYATVKDATVIGELISRAASEALAEVNGPTWYVDRDNPAHTEARKQAIHDARRRADAYAEALGVRLGAVLEVSEPGVAYRRDPIMYSAVDSVSSESPDEPELEVETGDLDISASVEVVYRIEQ